MFCMEHGRPNLLGEWHPTLNGGLSPETVAAGSRKKVWWQCQQGHQWQALVKSRAIEGTGCPVCAHRRVSPGESDLATACPELALQWHPTKNGDLTPQAVFPGSIRKVWWQCREGHEWEASISSRRRCGCPYCAGRAIIPGYNDLASLYPGIAAQWHPELNGETAPDSISPFSNKKVWWVCEKGHAWDAAVALRTGKNQGCPYYANRRILPGFNDLRTKAPRVAAQWHPELNGGLTPEMVTPGSKKKAWWQCPQGHVWKAVIYSRASSQQHGCPICSGRYKARTPSHIETP